MIVIPEKCLRERTDCKPLSQIASDCGTSFFCCGENDGTRRGIEQDKFTTCFKGEFRDEISFSDKRDIIHQAAVLVQAIAVVERNHDDATDWSPWA